MSAATIKHGTTFRASLTFTEGTPPVPVDLSAYSVVARLVHRADGHRHDLTIDGSEKAVGIIYVSTPTDALPLGLYDWDLKFVSGPTDKFVTPTAELLIVSSIS